MGACYNCTRSTYYVQCPSRTSVRQQRMCPDVGHAYYVMLTTYIYCGYRRGPWSKALSSNGFGFCALVLRYFWFMGVFRCLIRSAIGTITLVRHSSWCETHGSVSLQRPSAESFYGEKSSCPHSRPRGYEIRSPPHRVLSLCGRRPGPGARPADRGTGLPGGQVPQTHTFRPPPSNCGRPPDLCQWQCEEATRRGATSAASVDGVARGWLRAGGAARACTGPYRALPAHTRTMMRFVRIKSSTSRRS